MNKGKSKVEMLSKSSLCCTYHHRNSQPFFDLTRNYSFAKQQNHSGVLRAIKNTPDPVRVTQS